MSAIWGSVMFEASYEADAIQKYGAMKDVYQRKCKVDRILDKSKDRVYMGCGLQYVTAAAKHEQLPIFDEDTVCYFTADCILDNRQQLLMELDLNNENDVPDGTLMYYAYKKWGIDCLTHFRGLFSMAIYDDRKKVLYLASDPASSRCLYYYRKDNEIFFSTLIEPILEVNNDITINDFYLKDFLTAPGLMPNISAVETPYEKVYKLNPGVYLECTSENITEHHYFDISKPLPDCRCKTAKQYGKYFRELYQKCIADAINTDGEIGITMSSGLDSASVGAFAADLIKPKGKTLYSYTYVTSENGVKDNNRNHVLDEEQDVMDIIKMHDNIIPEFLNNDGKNCYEDMEKCVEIMEIPFKACVNLPNLNEIYKKASSQGCKIVLSGQFGNSSVSHGYIDDVLYDLYLNRKYFDFLFYLNNHAKIMKLSRKATLKGCIAYYNKITKIYNEKNFNYKPDNLFINDKITDKYPLEERLKASGLEIFEKIPKSQALYRNLVKRGAVYTYLGELDTKFGLAHNIVLRDPTRDERILRFCYCMPYKYFAYKGIPRWLIRGNLRDILPEYMINKLVRYCVQNSDWFLRVKRDWKYLQNLIRDSVNHPSLTEYIDKNMVNKFVDEFEMLEDDEAKNKMFYLLMILSMEKFIKKSF